MADPAPPTEPPATTPSSTLVDASLPLFVATIFTSASLLFLVQPMFTKMVLPVLGGTPAVWSVAMVFFQGLLLLGYGYAHLSARYLPLRVAVVVHVLLLSGTILALPIALPPNLGRPPANGEALWLVGTFALSVGMPFFTVSTTGPLLQAWFARTGHRTAGDPYFLYGASNLGSFGGLLLYPLVVERQFLLQTQTIAWSLGYATLALLISACGFLTRAVAADQGPVKPAADAPPVPWDTRLAWIGYAFVPSGLMVAVTSYISTDLGSAPFLWVVPLTLYLLTFVLVYRDPPLVSTELLTKLAPPTLLVVTLALFRFDAGFVVNALLHTFAFLLLTLLAHARLYEQRPPPARLTEFYLSASLGGVLGGLFTSLFAPAFFDDVYEYPILLALSLLTLPKVVPQAPGRVAGEWAVLVGGGLVAAFALPRIAPALGIPIDGVMTGVTLGVPLLVWFFQYTPWRATALALVMLVTPYLVRQGRFEEYKSRSFFGVNAVRRDPEKPFRYIIHGTTLHGAQKIANDDGTPLAGTPPPTTYYSEYGAIYRALRAQRAAQGGRMPEVAVAGLGSGALACHRVEGEAWSFYEIDPEVIDIATRGTWFTFLPDCAPDARIVQGDARLSLEDETRKFDLLVVDCFSADAIPMHLLTVEALRTYADHLAPGGAILLHISNRYVDLEPVISAAANLLGLGAVFMTDPEPPAAEDAARVHYVKTEIVVLTADPAHRDAFLALPGARPALESDPRSAWTDDFSNLIGAMVDKRRKRQREAAEDGG